jgi:hypothetical protein
MVPRFAVCAAAAAHTYQLPVSYLYVILAVEAGQVGRGRGEQERHTRLGPFQVNSVWRGAVFDFRHSPVEQAPTV